MNKAILTADNTDGADQTIRAIRVIRVIRGQWIEQEASRGAALVLEPDDAHLWRVSLLASDDRSSALGHTLSTAERQRADSFRFAEHRRRFVVGRGVLRALLGRYLERAPADLEFLAGPNGKPSLARFPNAREVFFNVSRSEDLALIAVTCAGEIGVDLERVRPVPEWPDIAQRILARDRDATVPATLDEFFQEWTRHEARIKAAGLGLGDHPAGERKWTVRSLAIENDFVAAVAFPTGVRRFCCWNWAGELVTA